MIEKIGPRTGLLSFRRWATKFVLGKCDDLLRTKLFVCDHLAKVFDVLFDVGDPLWPGAYALVWDSGGVLSFGFGEAFQGVLQFLL